MDKTTFLYELQRCCSDKKSSLEELLYLFLQEDLEHPEYDIDAADWCVKFCLFHRGCSMADNSQIRRFIRRTDSKGKVTYLVYDINHSWMIEAGR